MESWAQVTLIDRIAKAIELRDTTDAHAMARAALTEMMLPTEEMVERGNSVRGNHDATWSEGNDTRSIFRAMIHEALR